MRMRVLKIDLDIQPSEEWLKKWIITRQAILRGVGYSMVYHRRFPTKRGLHVYIYINREVDDETGNMLQFLLGDDHTRVKINMWRIKRGIKRWNKLFHKVLYRKKAKVLECHYCGNKIPVPDRWFE